MCVWPGVKALQGGRRNQLNLGFSCCIHNRYHSSLLMEVIKVLFPSVKLPCNVAKKKIIHVALKPEEATSEVHEKVKVACTKS